MFPLIAGWLAKMFTLEIAKIAAYRLMLLTLLVVVLPAVLENFLVYLMDTFVSVANQHLSQTEIGSGVLIFTGIGAYLADVFNLVPAAAVILSAISLRFALSMIPFVRL